MTTQELYHHFNQRIPLVRKLASELAKDFDRARFLYQETFHRAMRNRGSLRADSMDAWLNRTVKEAFLEIN